MFSYKKISLQNLKSELILVTEKEILINTLFRKECQIFVVKTHEFVLSCFSFLQIKSSQKQS